MLRSVDLSDYMLHDPIKVFAGEHMFVAINLIIEHRVSGVCVVDEKDMLVGCCQKWIA